MADASISQDAALDIPQASQAEWLHVENGDICEATEESISFEITRTCDMWQRTYYGFRFDSCPARVWTCNSDATFSAKVNHTYSSRFDQCGLLVYVNSDCWAKSSIEWETEEMSHLGSVVTNGGFSDWATQEIPSQAQGETWYRISRRGPDFCFEWSSDGLKWKQLRVFHLSESISSQQLLLPVRIGVYAGSPVAPTCKAVFTEFSWSECCWKAHEA